MKTRNPFARLVRNERPKVIPDKRAKKEARLTHKALRDVITDNRSWQ